MKINRITLGVIADDFTGASDAASFLANAGAAVKLYNGIPQDEPESGQQAVVIALKSRTAPKEQAVADSLAAAKWLLAAGARQIFFKYCSTFDSTPEGNIGPVSDALMELCGAPYSLLCPSLPVNGRRVKDGRLSVNGVPLHESSMRNHPLTPMLDDRLQVLMEPQSRYPAFVVTLADMEDAAALEEKIAAWKAEHAHFYLIPDYYEDAHAGIISGLFGDLPVLTGGSGLLSSIGRRIAGDDAVPAEREMAAPGSAVLLSGSCSEMTLKQVAAFLGSGAPALRLDPEKILAGQQTEEDVFDFLRGSRGDAVLLYSSDAPENVRRAQAAGREKVSDVLEAMTARAAVRALEEGRTRIIVAGGETSGAVTKALGFESFYIGRSVAPGVPVMIPCARTDVRLVLKSGNFGQPDFFLRAIGMTAE